MNDSFNPRPARPQKPLQNRQRAARAPVSFESRFIGYLVLGFGVLAMTAVLILAFSGGRDDAPDAPDESAIAAGLGNMAKDKVENSAPRPANAMVLPRQAIDPDSVEGGWQAAIGPYIAVMQLEKGAFQIILARPEPEFPRIYSSGVFQVTDDIVTLAPRQDWSAPQAKPGTNVSYERLTTGEYAMIAGFKDNAMIWQNVPRDEKRVLSHARSPLLVDSSQNYIVWKKAN